MPANVRVYESFACVVFSDDSKGQIAQNPHTTVDLSGEKLPAGKATSIVPSLSILTFCAPKMLLHFHTIVFADGVSGVNTIVPFEIFIPYDCSAWALQVRARAQVTEKQTAPIKDIIGDEVFPFTESRNEKSSTIEEYFK